jgi:hypothetical protein
LREGVINQKAPAHAGAFWQIKKVFKVLRGPQLTFRVSELSSSLLAFEFPRKFFHSTLSQLLTKFNLLGITTF